MERICCLLIRLLPLYVSTLAIDNGLGLLPPMGWRNWWSMFGDVDQSKMELSMTKMGERKREAAGIPGKVSFADLGYVHGMDELSSPLGRTQLLLLLLHYSGS
jgi:hypothetical protein